MIAPARLAAYDCLIALSSGRAELGTTLEQARGRLSDARDRALVTDIATGVQRWRAALDHVIAACAKRRVDQLDPEVVEILRLSAYQLLHLTRVPAAAVVDDAVNLTGRVGKKSARGFVNAVLRSISRTRKALPLPPRPSDAPGDASASNYEAKVAYLSVSLSHPRWLVERWLDRFGFEATERWLQFNNAAGALTLRANTARTTAVALRQQLEARGITSVPGRYAPEAILIERGDRGLTADLDALAGAFVVQDEASQLVALLAGPHPGPRVLDTCASPGGKTTALAAGVQDGFVVACDVRERRMQVLNRTVALTGVSHVHLAQADLLHPLPFRAVFDCVFVDAPCSGLGTLRRDPDLKWRRSLSDLTTFASAQRTMLQHAAAVVAPGGRLIYATCSSEPEENDAVAGAFAILGGFRPLDASTLHPALVPALVDREGALRTAPHLHQLDAFYGVAFERIVM